MPEVPAGDQESPRVQARLNIKFRQILDNLPPDWSKGLHWYVEAHDGLNYRDYPVGIAYCVIGVRYKTLFFLHVVDHHRRHGVGTALVRACQGRWPDIVLTEAISKAGRGLLQSLEE